MLSSTIYGKMLKRTESNQIKFGQNSAADFLDNAR